MLVSIQASLVNLRPLVQHAFDSSCSFVNDHSESH